MPPPSEVELVYVVFEADRAYLFSPCQQFAAALAVGIGIGVGKDYYRAL